MEEDRPPRVRGSLHRLLEPWFPPGTQPSVRRGAVLAAFMIGLNLMVGAFALLVAGDFPALAGLALVAWGFGLRHAMDADHIAAIDNVTRRLLYRGKPSVGVGAYFSLGHSLVVVLCVAAIAFALPSVREGIGEWRESGALVGASISSVFLLVIGAMNLGVLLRLLRARRDLRAGRENTYHGHMHLGGPIEALFRPLLRLVDTSAKMAGIGFLFGLGLDTATEVGLLALSAGAAGEVPAFAIMLLPLAFFAGMALLDTLNGLAMLGIYAWGEVEPERRLRYNIAMTGLSLASALGIGSIVGLRAIAAYGGYSDGVFAIASAIRLEAFGYLLATVFCVCFVASLMMLRRQGT